MDENPTGSMYETIEVSYTDLFRQMIEVHPALENGMRHMVDQELTAELAGTTTALAAALMGAQRPTRADLTNAGLSDVVLSRAVNANEHRLVYGSLDADTPWSDILTRATPAAGNAKVRRLGNILETLRDFMRIHQDPDALSPIALDLQNGPVVRADRLRRLAGWTRKNPRRVILDSQGSAATYEPFFGSVDVAPVPRMAAPNTLMAMVRAPGASTLAQNRHERRKLIAHARREIAVAIALHGQNAVITGVCTLDQVERYRAELPEVSWLTYGCHAGDDTMRDSVLHLVLLPKRLDAEALRHRIAARTGRSPANMETVAAETALRTVDVTLPDGTGRRFARWGYADDAMDCEMQGLLDEAVCQGVARPRQCLRGEPGAPSLKVVVYGVAGLDWPISEITDLPEADALDAMHAAGIIAERPADLATLRAEDYASERAARYAIEQAGGADGIIEQGRALIAARNDGTRWREVTLQDPGQGHAPRRMLLREDREFDLTRAQILGKHSVKTGGKAQRSSFGIVPENSIEPTTWPNATDTNRGQNPNIIIDRDLSEFPDRPVSPAGVAPGTSPSDDTPPGKDGPEVHEVGLAWDVGARATADPNSPDTRPFAPRPETARMMAGFGLFADATVISAASPPLHDPEVMVQGIVGWDGTLHDYRIVPRPPSGGPPDPFAGLPPDFLEHGPDEPMPPWWWPEIGGAEGKKAAT